MGLGGRALRNTPSGVIRRPPPQSRQNVKPSDSCGQKTAYGAYQRLVDLELDDFSTDLFRFRLSGKERLYGFRIEAEAMFYMLWYDPHHKIYPS